MSHKQMIIIRRDLKMRRGKEISQGAHSSMGAVLSEKEIVTRDDGSQYIKIELDDRNRDWLLGSFTKITTTVDSLDEILELAKMAKDMGMYHSLITDSGRTEFNGVPTVTALSIGPDTIENIDKITKHLKLY